VADYDTTTLAANAVMAALLGGSPHQRYVRSSPGQSPQHGGTCDPSSKRRDAYAGCANQLLEDVKPHPATRSDAGATYRGDASQSRL
jgi:hypothetical protein